MPAPHPVGTPFDAAARKLYDAIVAAQRSLTALLGAAVFRTLHMVDIQKKQIWQHPNTGERVEISFDGAMTRIERSGRISELPNPPWSEAAALAQARANLAPSFQWSPSNVVMWRDQLFAMNSSDAAETRKAFLATSLPEKLWDDIDAYQRLLGYKPSSEPNRPMAHPEGAWFVHFAEPGQLAEAVPQGTIVIRIDDPAFDDSLLFHPTGDVKATFEHLHMQLNVGVSPPLIDARYDEEAARLKREGWVRSSAFDIDGKRFLPPKLATCRAPIERSVKPVLRLAACPSRTPRAWDSKIGGVPYRPMGQPWPCASEDAAAPLLFLAQVNCAHVNGAGTALPDHPSRGLLQIYISNTDLYGVASDEMGRISPDVTQRHYRVIYHADVIEDAAALESSVPDMPGHLEGCWLPHGPMRETVLTVIPDAEPVTWGDHTASAILGVDITDDDDAGAQALGGALLNITVEGHKLGGYPTFTQRDPRTPDQDHVLLLQLDSDEALGLMWGDLGIANFFIRPADLEARDFSRVAFHWDCS